MIIDSHLHLWNPDCERTPWRRGWSRHAHGPHFGIDDALAAMAAAGVERAAVLPAAWDVHGNQLVLEAAAQYPERFAAFVTPDLRRPGGRVELAAWQARGARGFRVMFPPGVEPSWLADGAADWLWAAAQELSVPVMTWAPGQLPALLEVARRHPRLRLVLDHLNMAMSPTAVEAAAAVEELCAAADLPALAVKASALPCLPGDPRPLVGRVVDAFGQARVFWGSDLGRLPCTYSEAVAHVAGCGPALTGDAFRAWIDWPPAAARVR